MTNNPSNDTIVILFQGHALKVSNEDVQRAVAIAQEAGLGKAVELEFKAYKRGVALCPVFNWMMNLDPSHAVDGNGYRDFLITHTRISVCSILDEFSIGQSKVNATCRLWLAVAVRTEIYRLEKKRIEQFYDDLDWTEAKGKGLRALGKSLQKVAAYIRSSHLESGEFPTSVWTILQDFNTATHIEYALCCLKQIGPDRVYKLLCNPVLHFDSEAKPYRDFLVVQVERMLKQLRDDPSFWTKLTGRESGSDGGDHEESEDDYGESEGMGSKAKGQEDKEPKGSGSKKNKEDGTGLRAKRGNQRALDEDLTSDTRDSIKGAFKNIKNFLNSTELEKVPQEHWWRVRDTLHDLINLKSLLNSKEITWQSPRKEN